MKRNTESKTTILDLCFGLLHYISYLVVILVAVVVALDVVLEPKVDPYIYKLVSPPEFYGPLGQNTLLRDHSTRLYEDQLLGPESLVIHNGHIYTGTADGKVLDIYDDTIHVLTKLGTPPCGINIGGGFNDEHTCGRPLGMRLLNEDNLLVLDADLGLFRVNIFTGVHQLLLSSSAEIGGYKSFFFNDLTVTRDGSTVYITDTSTIWHRRDFPYIAAEHQPTGRLVKFDINTKVREVLIPDMDNPNGVQLSPDEDYLLIAIMHNCYILKFYLNGPRAGEKEVWADNMPGIVDNIRPSVSGGYWISLHKPRFPGKFNFLDFLGDKPWLRKFMTKVHHEILKDIFRLEYFITRSGDYGLIAELNEKGDIRRTLHDPTGEFVYSVSEVNEYKGTLYLGSANAPFIVRVYL